MRQALALLILVTLIAPPSWAQAPAKRKGNRVVRFLVGPWKALVTDWKFAVAVAPMAVGLGLDCHSTALLQRRRPGAVELNPFLPEHPTPRQLVAYCGLEFSGHLYVMWGMKGYAEGIKSRKSYEPYLWPGAYSVGVGAIHGAWGARLNYNLITCPSGSYKPPGLPGCVAR